MTQEPPGRHVDALRPILGAVLAGGRSRRFGRDKSRERVDGVPMLERSVRTLAAVCEAVVVVSSHHGPEYSGCVVIPDVRPGQGPLAGIETALRHAAQRGMGSVFVLATDLPDVGPEIARLVLDAALEAFGPSGHVEGSAEWHPRAFAAERAGEPDFEPLCAVYTVGCLGAAAGLLDEGGRAAQGLFRAVDGVRVPLSAAQRRAVGLNVNRLSDLDSRA